LLTKAASTSKNFWKADFGAVVGEELGYIEILARPHGRHTIFDLNPDIVLIHRGTMVEVWKVHCGANFFGVVVGQQPGIIELPPESVVYQKDCSFRVVSDNVRFLVA
jgi:hypothetical protein